MRVLVAGCGYLGLPIALELARQGHEVVGLRRTPAADSLPADTPSIAWMTTDLTQPDGTLPEGRFDAVIFALGGTCSAVLEGTRRLLAHFAAEPPTRYLHLGCTEVYGQTDGSVVKENHPTDPLTELGRAHVEAERLVLAAIRNRFPAVLLRVARIYGPGREHDLAKFIRNEVRLAGQGHRNLNLIHLDDAVGGALAALKSGRPGEIYNLVDQEPVTEIHFFTWLAESLGKYVPPFAPPGEPGAKASIANARISNRRLAMELGHRLKYPTFRQGMTAELKRLTEAGQLDIPREER
ncbi:MAG: NAD-dependent epimerase/dehydratase family protein [Verrucomicrobiales bacterium]|nr:NAD-dependent epimerase/dehydratase family protein [Verrucomicrobiales bacterium]